MQRKKRIKDLINAYEDEGSEELKKRYVEKYNTDDLDEYGQDQLKAIYEVLKGRGESVPEKYTKYISKASSNKSARQGKEIEHKIVSGPVLSGQDKLKKKLNRLGNKGWGLIDTQRHSIAGKQHAVCFLRKDSAFQEQNKKLDEINDKLGKLLELLEESSRSTKDEEKPSSTEDE